MELGIIIFLGLTTAVLAYAVVNLIRKNEAMEDVINSYIALFSNLDDEILKAQSEIKKIDIRGSFDSDDEVGFFFTYLKDIQNRLSKYKSENIQDESNTQS